MDLEELRVIISVKTKDVAAKLNNIKDKFKGLGQEAVKATDKINKSTSNINPKMNTEVLKAQISNVARTLDNVNARIEQQQAKLAKLKESYNTAFGDRKNKLGEQILKTEGNINSLVGKSDKLGFKLGNLDDKFASVTNAGKKTSNGMNELKNELKRVGDSTANLQEKAKKSTAHLKSMGNASKSASRNFGEMQNNFGYMMGQMFKWMILFPAIVQGLAAIGSYVMSTLMVNNQFANSLNQIKSNLMTAFMPIYQAALPAINALMSTLSTATAYIASFISQLFGSTYDASFNSAKNLQSSIGAYNQQEKAAKKAANALGGAGSAAKKAGKEAKGSLAAFDEINQLQKSKEPDEAGSGVVSSITPMANMAPIEAVTSKWVNKFKKLMSQIFQPFREAWAKEGQQTIESMKYAWNSIGELVTSIGKSFLEVWTNGTGTTMLSTILEILQDVFNLIGDIASTFANAWNSGDIGTQIIQGIGSSINNVLSLIKKIGDALRESWGNVGTDVANTFMSILKSTGGVLENLSQKLVWVWDNGGEHLFQGFVNLGAKIFELAGTIYNEFVAPFANWFIDTISPAIAEVTDVLGSLFDKVSEVIDWLTSDGNPVLEGIVIVLGSVATAIGIVKLAIEAWNIACAAASLVTGGFSAAITFLTSPIGIAIIAISAIIAAGVLLYQNWDWLKEKAAETWAWIKEKFQSFADWLGSVFETDWSQKFGFFGDILNGFLANVGNIWNAIKQVFGGVIDFVAGVFTGNWARAWQGVKEIFGGIFDGLSSMVKWPLNNIIGLVNGAISGINRMIRVINRVPGVYIPSVPKIPYLAKGGIINSPTLAMVGEAGKEAVVPLENNTKGIDLLASKILERIPSRQDNEGDGDVIFQIDGSIIGKVAIKELRKAQRQGGISVIPV
ncbi:hypothetical protein [Clostridium sp. HBUAS56017]|uniref:hypothetical protein n=1 Tax=Clostridium sp. HBUAS56017 TaxID=2571128 RepID=UPI00117793E1|nr:hypothetical protein [Clostridium sp. HBUAS56017]